MKNLLIKTSKFLECFSLVYLVISVLVLTILKINNVGLIAVYILLDIGIFGLIHFIKGVMGIIIKENYRLPRYLIRYNWQLRKWTLHYKLIRSTGITALINNLLDMSFLLGYLILIVVYKNQ